MRWLSSEEVQRTNDLIRQYRELDEQYIEAARSGDAERAKDIALKLRPVYRELGEIFDLPTDE